MTIDSNKARVGRLNEIAEKAENDPMNLSKEEIVYLQSQLHGDEEADQIAEAYMTLKKDCPEIFVESVKVDIALATKADMPPKKWSTNPYFPRR